MSTLTKIFIVLMVIFSIAFTMSIIGFVARTGDWKDLATKYSTQQQVIDTNMRNLSAAHIAEKAASLDINNGLRESLGRLEQDEAEHLGTIEELRAEVANLKAERTGCNAQSSRLTSELNVAQNGWLEQRKQREELENRNFDIEQRNLDLNKRVDELTAQIVVLVQYQRQLEQQRNILQGEARKVAKGGSGEPDGMSSPPLAGVTPLRPAAAAPIRGHVLEVRGDLATISVGSADGVAQGMTFFVRRGSEYICDIQVTHLEPNLSAGRVTSMHKAPRATDLVTSE